jgi:hypothetical protein
VLGSAALSPPDTDLSVLPIVPPTLPGCTCATQGAENVAMKKMGKMKRRIGLSHAEFKLLPGKIGTNCLITIVCRMP